MTQAATKHHVKDAVTLLTHDHQEVKKAFKEYEALGERAFVTKKKLASEIYAALTIHAR